MKKNNHSLLKNKKGAGVVGAWIGGFVGMFIIVLVWIITTPIFNTIITSLSGVTSSEQVLSFFSVLQTIWRLIPLLYLIAWALWVVVSGLRREPMDDFVG